MLTSGKNGAVRTRVTADSARIRDVLADECALAPVAEDSEDDTRYRLAEPVFRHCEQLATDPAWRGGRPASSPAGDVDPDGLLSGKERGALGLVLVGGLGYVRASGVLGICPRDLAALLRAALLRMAAAPAAVEDGRSGKWLSARGPRARRGTGEM